MVLTSWSFPFNKIFESSEGKFAFTHLNNLYKLILFISSFIRFKIILGTFFQKHTRYIVHQVFLEVWRLSFSGKPASYLCKRPVIFWTDAYDRFFVFFCHSICQWLFFIDSNIYKNRYNFKFYFNIFWFWIITPNKKFRHARY